MDERYAPVLQEVEALGSAFASAGFALYLVGGIVRDIHLGVALDQLDFDLTTNARPDEILPIVKPLASAVWTQGEKFGTIGARINDRPFEITTHRAESYSEQTRKPIVAFGQDLNQDLSRRDFTLNAMAIRVPDGELFDPFEGLKALEEGVLVTPIEPEVSFSDDPLRILRAARFIARYELRVDPVVIEAAQNLIDRMSIVSTERIRDEFDKLLMAATPSAGFEFLIAVNAWPYVIGAIDVATVSEIAEAVDAAPLDIELRRALVFSFVSVSDRKSILSSLRYSNAERRSIQVLLNGADAVNVRTLPFDAPGVRRLVAAVGHGNLGRLQQFLALRGLDDCGLAAEFERLSAGEDLASLSPELSGEEVMAILDIESGPQVGQALALLQKRRFDEGPLHRSGEAEFLKNNFAG